MKVIKFIKKLIQLRAKGNVVIPLKIGLLLGIAMTK